MRSNGKSQISLILLICFSFESVTAQDKPEWYNGNRFSVHTRLSIKQQWWDSAQFWDWPDELNRMGVSVSVRHIKGAEEGAWWKSSVGTIHPRVYDAEADGMEDGDIAAMIIRDAHENDIKQIAYYRHPDDKWAENNHPDWLCRNRANKVVQTATRGAWMSLASPYGDFVITRIKELAERGADGIYFDGKHIPPDGDFNSYAQEKYSAWHGGADLLATSTKQAKAFRQELLVDFFTRATKAFHKINTEGVILMSANRSSLDSLRAADAPKYEALFNGNLGGLPVAATILTDIGGGYPHLWRNTSDSLYTAARYIAFGAIYNRDVKEAEVYDVPDSLHKDYAAIFELGLKVSPAMKDVEPLRYARVLMNGSMIVKETKLSNKIPDAWTLLRKARIPAGFLSYAQLKEGGAPAGTEVLVVPIYNRNDVPNNLGAAVDDFEGSGGLVIYKNDISDMISMIAARGPVPISSYGGNGSTGMITFTNSQKVVVNISAKNQNNLVVTLSSQYYDRPAKVIETVTGKTLTVANTSDGWVIEGPAVSVMAQLVITFSWTGDE
jgi:hypothetical protein